MSQAATTLDRRADVHEIAVAPKLPAMAALPLVAFDGARRVATVAHGARRFEAPVDPSIDGAVMQTALRNEERVLVQQDGAGWLVLGALRTKATPGVDRGDEYVIDARRVTVQADESVALTSGEASITVRALGYVETLASDITSRAARAHKIIGRILRLN